MAVIRRLHRYLGWALLVAPILIGAWASVPHFVNARVNTQFLACRHRQNRLASALEMYQLDDNVGLPSALTPELLEVLTSRGYLPEDLVPLRDPGSYSDPAWGPAWHYQLIQLSGGHARVYCARHGPGDPPPEAPAVADWLGRARAPSAREYLEAWGVSEPRLLDAATTYPVGWYPIQWWETERRLEERIIPGYVVLVLIWMAGWVALGRGAAPQ